MQTRFERYSSAKFNNLPAIEDADAMMRKNAHLDLAIHILGPIFANYDLCEVFGIAILHNHWFLSDGELPIQDHCLENSRKVLLTCPRTTSFEKEFAPSVFRISSEAPFLRPLEFSTDKCVFEANEVLRKKSPEFALSLSQAAVEKGLEHTFGLCVIRKTSNPAYELVEFNGPDRISLVREIEIGSVAHRSLLDTCWMFDKNEATASCESSCFSRCFVNKEGKHYEHRHDKAHRRK
jgi:hypothetical protein